MRGGLYMRRVSARNEFGMAFPYPSYSPFTKRTIQNQILFMEHVLIQNSDITTNKPPIPK